METINQIEARRAYAAVCAKLGQPDAANARPSGSLAELHSSRKAVRRLLNTLAATPEPDDAEALATAHAANLVERINGTINALGGHEDATQEGPKAMRTADDFREHYLPKAAPDERIDLGDFMRGVAGMKTSAAVRNALDVGTDSAGGYAVPSLVMPTILEALVPASSLLRAGAGIVPLDMGAKTFTQAAISSIATAAWRLESGSVAESNPVFRGVVIKPQSLSFSIRISRELLADASNVSAALARSIAQSMAVEMDRAGLRGSGSAPEPRGILNTSGIQSVTNGANGTALAGYANFFSAAQALLAANAPWPTAAIMAPRSLTKLGGLVDTLGQSVRIPPMFENVPFIPTSQIPVNLTVGSSSDCSELYLGDFSRVNFYMREGISILVAPEVYAGTGEIGFFCHSRIDVGVLYPAAFAVVTGVRA